MSTFVSIGNGTQSFSRLLDAVKTIADHLPQPVVVQHGRTPFFSDDIEHFAFTDESDFLDRLGKCQIFITHAGGGSVFSAIRLGKKPVVVPRRKAHDEIVDDHQMAFAEELARQRKIEPVYDVAELLDAVANVIANPHLPPEPEGERPAFAKIASAITAFAPNTDDPICLVTPSGGHLTEIRALAKIYSAHPHIFVINVPIVEPQDMQGRTHYLTLSERDWKLALNFWEAYTFLRRERPKVILTTGGAFSVAFTIIGKFLGIPTIYIETVAKVNIPTLTGRFMYRLADRFFYQWPQLQKFFLKGDYIGLIL